MAVQEQVADAGEAERAKHRQLWLERVGRELAVAEIWEADRAPDRLAERLDRMVEASAESDALSPQDKIDIRDRARATKIKTYQKHIDFLLEQAMVVTRDKERQTERGEMLRRVNDAFNIAIRLGVGDAIKQGIKDRLEIIMHTSAAGDSTTAKVAADREAARVEAAAHPKEHRTFTRWTNPPIVVAIGGRTYSTIDWSLGGALLEEVENRGWKCGQPIDVKIGLPDGKLHADKMVVVRYSPEQKRLAIRSRRFASVFMLVKRDCDAAGLEPV
jgi:hypothetical protein